MVMRIIGRRNITPPDFMETLTTPPDFRKELVSSSEELPVFFETPDITLKCVYYRGVKKYSVVPEGELDLFPTDEDWWEKHQSDETEVLSEMEWLLTFM
jgi:hypothetical protein